MGIKHRADSFFHKFLPSIRLSPGGQVSSFEMPYVSYPQRYTQSRLIDKMIVYATISS